MTTDTNEQYNEAINNLKNITLVAIQECGDRAFMRYNPMMGMEVEKFPVGVSDQLTRCIEELTKLQLLVFELKLMETRFGKDDD